MLVDVIKDKDGSLVVNGTKKVLTPLINDKDFKKFFEKIINDLNESFIIFIEANGHDFKDLELKKENLDKLFAENQHYKQYITKFLSVKENIEMAQYIGENVIYMKRKLSKEMNYINDFIRKYYPDTKPKHKIKNLKRSVLAAIKKTIVFAVSIVGFVAFVIFLMDYFQ